MDNRCSVELEHSRVLYLVTFMYSLFSLCIRIHMHMYIYIYMYVICEYIYKCKHVCIHIYIYIHIYKNVSMYLYVKIYLCIYMYLYGSICIYMDLYVSICIYVSIYIHLNIRKFKYTNWYFRLPPGRFSLARRAIQTYGIQLVYINIHLDIRIELVFHTTSGALWSGPPCTD